MTYQLFQIGAAGTVEFVRQGREEQDRLVRVAYVAQQPGYLLDLPDEAGDVIRAG